MSNPFDAYRMDGRVAVVTGAASGIGAATCGVLAAAGASVVCADVDADGLASTVATVEAAGVRALAVPTDVTQRDQVAAMIDAAVEEFGRVDAVDVLRP